MVTTNTARHPNLNINDFPPLSNHSVGVEIGSGSGHQDDKPSGEDSRGTSNELNKGDKGNRVPYVNLFRNNRTPNEKYKLEFVEPSKRTLKFDYYQIDSVEKTYGICLLGFVLNGKPSTTSLLNLVRLWGQNIRFQTHDSGWITFVFPDEELRNRILSGGNYMVAGHHLFIKEMPRCFRFKEEDMRILPAWIQVHELPPDCWNFEILSNVVSEIGVPIHVDMLMFDKKRTKYARVLVEVDTTTPRVTNVVLDLPIGKVDISVVYEHDIKLCSCCSRAGHEDSSCKNTVAIFDDSGNLVGYKMITRSQSKVGQRKKSWSRSTSRNTSRGVSPVIPTFNEAINNDSQTSEQADTVHGMTTENLEQPTLECEMEIGSLSKHDELGDNNELIDDNDTVTLKMMKEAIAATKKKNVDKGKHILLEEHIGDTSILTEVKTSNQTHNVPNKKNKKQRTKNKKKTDVPKPENHEIQQFFEDMVESTSCDSSTDHTDCEKCFSGMKKPLKALNCKHFSHISSRVTEPNKKLETMQNDMLLTGITPEEYKDIRGKT